MLQVLLLVCLSFWGSAKSSAIADSIPDGSIKPMKICIYSHSLPPEVDGVSRRFHLLIDELLRNGHEVFAFTLEEKVNMQEDLRIVHKLKHARIPTYPTKKIAAPNPADLWRTVEILRQEKPDIIHAVVDGVTTQFIMAARIVGIPIVGSIHTDVQRIIEATVGKSTAFGSWVMRGLVAHKEKKDAQQMDRCGTTSKSFRQKIQMQGVDCPFIVPTSVNVEVFRNKYNDTLRNTFTFGHPEAKLAVYVGRLAPEKGIDKLIKWVTANPNTYLGLFGDGPLNETLKSQHGADKRIYCQPGMKSHEELAVIYSTADVHVSASVFETLGNTVLEAQACGTPVVVPRTQGFQDTVKHERDGFLYDPDHPEGATRYLKQLFDDQDLMSAFAEKGKQKVIQNHTVVQAALHIANWYRKTIDEVPVRSPYDLELIMYTLAPYPVWFCYDCCHMSWSTAVQVIACLVVLAVHRGLTQDTWFSRRCQTLKVAALRFILGSFDDDLAEGLVSQPSSPRNSDDLDDSIYHQ